MQPTDLDQEVRQSLLTLSRETADLVARHLVMTGRLLEDDPEQALVHARAAGALAGRVAVVREAAGLAAYRAGEWTEAVSELRAARRMSGSAEHLPVLADCERALGRPERALAALDDRDVPSLDQATRVELVVVVAGARRDLGQHDAAVLLLQGPARATTARRPWAARLWYAYADALLDAGREDEAREWFTKTVDVDAGGATDAGERLLELDGVLFEDDDEQDDQEDGAPREPGEPDGESLEDMVAGMVPLATPEPTSAEAPDARTSPDAAAPAPAGQQVEPRQDVAGTDGEATLDDLSAGDDVALAGTSAADDVALDDPSAGDDDALDDPSAGDDDALDDPSAGEDVPGEQAPAAPGARRPASPFSSTPEVPPAAPVRSAVVPVVTFVAATGADDDRRDA